MATRIPHFSNTLKLYEALPGCLAVYENMIEKKKKQIEELRTQMPAACADTVAFQRIQRLGEEIRGHEACITRLMDFTFQIVEKEHSEIMRNAIAHQ
jgi:hypothetical protein